MAKVANGNAKHGSRVQLTENTKSTLSKVTEAQKADWNWEQVEFEAGTVFTVKEFSRTGTTTWMIPVENDRARIACSRLNLVDDSTPIGAPAKNDDAKDYNGMTAKQFRAAARKIGMSVRTHSRGEIIMALAAR